MTCPKTLRNGPCGGVRENGHCEVVPEMRCVWVKAEERSRTLPLLPRTWREHIHDLRPPVNNQLEGAGENMMFGGAGAEGESYQTVSYEGYGPGGVAIMAIALTDNRNRTAADVRHAFSRHGGTLGETGSVGWQFDTVGQIVVPVDGHDPDEIALLAIDAGATDVVSEADEIIITTEPGELSAVTETLREGGVDPQEAGVTRVPQNVVDIDAGQTATTFRLLEALEDLDDIQEVFTNASFAESAVPA
jgi:YebC/PmpR family DNA-binding regulatory protein